MKTVLRANQAALKAAIVRVRAVSKRESGKFDRGLRGSKSSYAAKRDPGADRHQQFRLCKVELRTQPKRAKERVMATNFFGTPGLDIFVNQFTTVQFRTDNLDNPIGPPISPDIVLVGGGNPPLPIPVIF